ncbi:hypothetical protein [Agrobacterium vitis]|uniref:hypothetical protein n=1 Tax=Agrobacterium vitis TaxID=373 RepID=UPI0018D20196|nr:hypothetical protein [Agrobacterium vitis]
MAETDRAYAGHHYVNYGQIGLWDKADPLAYPVPEGPLPWWGPKGVVVPAQDDIEVLVEIVYGNRLDKPGYKFLTKGEIEVGTSGVAVGNITTASASDIKVVQGRYCVECYFHGTEPAAASRLIFALLLV